MLIQTYGPIFGGYEYIVVHPPKFWGREAGLPEAFMSVAVIRVPTKHKNHSTKPL